MPIYEYQCNKCKDVFEIFHRIDEECQVSCPKCLGSARKLISASNFVLKGAGFYVNDYPSKSRHEGKKAEKAGTEKGGTEKAGTEKAGSEKSGNEKSESKPAEKKAD